MAPEPTGVLVDYGGTLVDEYRFAAAAGQARLLYARFGIAFDRDDAELELWRGSMHAWPQSNVVAALDAVAACGLRVRVVSNSGFTEAALRSGCTRRTAGPLPS